MIYRMLTDIYELKKGTLVTIANVEGRIIMVNCCSDKENKYWVWIGADLMYNFIEETDITEEEALLINNL